jgi:hypothetical protein
MKPRLPTRRRVLPIPREALLFSVLIGVLSTFFPAFLHGQALTHQKVSVLEFVPDDPAAASPEKLSQARDVLQHRLDLLWPRRRSRYPLATVALANNTLRVELGAGCEPSLASPLAIHAGAIVMTGSDQPLEVGTLVGKPEHILFTDSDFTASDTKPKRDETSRWTVPLTFRSEARQRFAEYTAAHVGAQLNLLMDGTVLLSARIMEPITDGNVLVSLKEEEQARQLALFLSSGRLPFKLQFTSENIVDETVPHSSLLEQKPDKGEFYDKLRAFVHSIPYDILGIVLSLGFLTLLFRARRDFAAKRIPAYIFVSLAVFLAYMLLRQLIPR